MTVHRTVRAVATERTQCLKCPWRDMLTMRAEFPDTVEHARAHPDGFVCHTRMGSCPGPRRAGVAA